MNASLLGNIAIELKGARINLLRAGAAQSVSDCVTLCFDYQDADEKEFAPTNDRRIYVYLIALIAELQRHLPRDVAGNRQFISAEMLWDCGGDYVSTLKKKPWAGKGEFSGNHGFYDLWTRRLPLYSDTIRRSYRLADDADAALIESWSKALRISEIDFMRTVFARRSVGTRDAKSMGMKTCSLYGIGPEWSVTVTDLASPPREVASLFRTLANTSLHGSHSVPIFRRYRLWAQSVDSGLLPPDNFVEPPMIRMPNVRAQASTSHLTEHLKGSRVSAARPSESHYLNDLTPGTLCVVLGCAGIGKSSLLKSRFQWELAHPAVSSSEWLLPVFIDLTDSPVLPEMLLDREVTRIRNSIGEKEYLRCRISLFCDGLDRMSSLQQLSDAVRDMHRLLQEGRISKCVATCKTDIWKAAMPEASPAITCLQLLPFSTSADGHAEQYFRLRFGPIWKQKWNHAQSGCFSELLSIPFYLRAISDLLTNDNSRCLWRGRIRIIEEWVERNLRECGRGDWYHEGCALLANIAYHMKTLGVHRLSPRQLAEHGCPLTAREQDCLDMAVRARILNTSGHPGRMQHVEFSHDILRTYYASMHLKDMVVVGGQIAVAVVNHHMERTRWDDVLIMAGEGITDHAMRQRLAAALCDADPQLTASIARYLSPSRSDVTAWNTTSGAYNRPGMKQDSTLTEPDTRVLLASDSDEALSEILKRRPTPDDLRWLTWPDLRLLSPHRLCMLLEHVYGISLDDPLSRDALNGALSMRDNAEYVCINSDDRITSQSIHKALMLGWSISSDVNAHASYMRHLTLQLRRMPDLQSDDTLYDVLMHGLLAHNADLRKQVLQSFLNNARWRDDVFVLSCMRLLAALDYNAYQWLKRQLLRKQASAIEAPLFNPHDIKDLAYVPAADTEETTREVIDAIVAHAGIALSTLHGEAWECAGGVRPDIALWAETSGTLTGRILEHLLADDVSDEEKKAIIAGAMRKQPDEAARQIAIMYLDDAPVWLCEALLWTPCPHRAGGILFHWLWRLVEERKTHSPQYAALLDHLVSSSDAAQAELAGLIRSGDDRLCHRIMDEVSQLFVIADSLVDVFEYQFKKTRSERLRERCAFLLLAGGSPIGTDYWFMRVTTSATSAFRTKFFRHLRNVSKTIERSERTSILSWLVDRLDYARLLQLRDWANGIENDDRTVNCVVDGIRDRRGIRQIRVCDKHGSDGNRPDWGETPEDRERLALFLDRLRV